MPVPTLAQTHASQRETVWSVQPRAVARVSPLTQLGMTGRAADLRALGQEFSTPRIRAHESGVSSPCFTKRQGMPYEPPGNVCPGHLLRLRSASPDGWPGCRGRRACVDMSFPCIAGYEKGVTPSRRLVNSVTPSHPGCKPGRAVNGISSP